MICAVCVPLSGDSRLMAMAAPSDALNQLPEPSKALLAQRT
jgi:hypothetical protein